MKKAAILLFCLLGISLVTTGLAWSEPAYKVLVVMSYEEDYPWDAEIREGIEAVLGGTSEIRYFYMDTKTNLAAGPEKAKEAYEMYQDFQPDGVITADDNAQSMFVVPYLKGKAVPVMFCGVNAAPADYGYPAANVSGILERYHIAESIALVQQLVPDARKIAYVLRDSPAGKAIIQQINQEKEKYSISSLTIKEPKTLPEALADVTELKDSVDVLFMTVWQGIPDAEGRPMTDREVIPLITEAFGKPTIGAVAFQVKSGALCAVVQTGQEQGRTAAEMLLKAMQGTPVSDLPITRNMNGKRMINVNELKALNIQPKPIVLRGVELVRSEN